MYQKFYGLKEEPFNITPDPRYLYFSDCHQEVFDHLMYGITRRKGFIELVGEVGSGKTTLLRAVIRSLPGNVKTAVVMNPSLTVTQILRSIAHDLGLRPRGRDRLSCIQQLNDFLLEQHGEGRNVALIIDEAQDLSDDALEEIRLLNNLETDQHKLMQIVLAGQPELKTRISGNNLRQLRQRIMVRCHLKALSEDETGRYIAHRLAVAGANGKVRFDEMAVERIHYESTGIPRIINALCDNAMLAGYVVQAENIGIEEVERAVEQMGQVA